jgi:Domain of unknown function (DUF4835)
MKKKYLSIILTAMVCFINHFIGHAQELNCSVNLSYLPAKDNQLAAGSPVINEVKNIISDFLNTRRFTKDEFSPTERINCALNITLTQATAQGDFDGFATITLNRPIFGTSFESPVFRFIDRNFNFKYQANTPIDYNENVYNNNLAQVLAFYANLILTLDYDTYSKMGGNPYAQKLYNIVNMVPSNSGFNGWKAQGQDTKNRYWLAENIMSPQMIPVREGLYTYHHLALDNFSADTFGARKKILALITKLSEINSQKPAAIFIMAFLDSKNEEIYNIFSKAPAVEKQKVYTLLSNIDPAHTEVYRKLLL